MKKFLFTLAALLMAGSLCAAENYMYVPDIVLTQEEATNGVSNKAILVTAHFEQYTSATDWWLDLPEGVEFVSANMPNAAKPYVYQYVDVEDDETGEITSQLTRQRMAPQIFGAYPHWIIVTALGAETDNCYSEDGSVCYGAPKWGVDPVEFTFMRVVVNIAANFTGGEIVVRGDLSGTPDPRGESAPQSSFEKVCTITVEKPAAEPAPVPTLTWSEDSYTMEATCEGHDVVQEQTITFVAYTVANADESGNSANVEQTVTVPAKEKDYAPAPIFREVDGKVYAEAEEGYEVVMMLEGEVCENPYTLPAANYEADQVFHFSAYTVKKNEYGNSATVEYNTTVAKLEKNTPTDPVIFTETTEDRVIVTVAADPNTDGELVYDGQPSYARGEQDYEVTVTAYTTEGATYKASGVTTKIFTVPALEQTPQPGEGNIYVKFTGTELPVGKKIIFVYENGENSLAMGTVGTKGAPVAVVVANGEVNIANTEVVEFTVGGGEVGYGTDIKQYTLEYSAGFLAYNSGTNFKTLTSIGTYDTEAYWRLQTTTDGYTLNNASSTSRYIRKHATNNNFGPYAKSTDSEEVVIYVEKTDEPVLQDLAGTIEFGEPTADGKVAVTYNGNEAGVVVTVEGYEVVDGMIQLPEYGTYTLNATATADGYNPLNVEGTVTWNAPVLPTLGGYFVWGVLDENGHFTVTYNNFDYDGDYTLVVKDEDGNVMELDADGEYYQALEGTHTYTAEVTAAGYQPKTETHEYTYVIPTYAPAPKLDWNEATFTMTAYLDTRAYSNEDIELYMNEVKVENPKTVAQTYTEQTLNFKARTIGKDGDNNSEWVYMNVTVPAKEMQDSQTPVITVTEGEDTYTISATPCTELLIDGVEQTNPYTVARPGIGEEDLVIFVTAINNDGEGYKDATATQRVVIPAKQPVMPAAPSVTTEETEGAVIVTASTTDGSTVVLYQCDANGENAFAVENPMSYTREATERTVYVYAVATNNDGSTRSEVKEVVIPAKKQDPETAINEMNADKAIASVRYFNMAGQEMQEANGMTIVVTTYTDGTSSAVKVMK